MCDCTRMLGWSLGDPVSTDLRVPLSQTRILSLTKKTEKKHSCVVNQQNMYRSTKTEKYQNFMALDGHWWSRKRKKQTSPNIILARC